MLQNRRAQLTNAENEKELLKTLPGTPGEGQAVLELLVRLEEKRGLRARIFLSPRR